MGETHAPEDCQEAGEPAPPTASPREGRRRPHMPSFGGGPGARARPGLRAEGHAARAGHAGGTAARPLSLSRDDARTTHTLGPRGRGRGRRPPRAPAPLRPPRRGARGGAPPRRRRGRLSLFPGGLTPLETARDDDRAAGAPSPPAGPLPPGGPADGERAPPPAPEADATETRAGVASARGLPDGRPRRRRGRTPGTAAAASHRRGPLPRHAPGGRRTAPSRGATPALLVFTRRPGGGSAPAAARTPSFGPHAAGKGDGGRDVRGPGRDRRRPRRAPSGRPSPQGGDTRRAAPPPLGTGSPALAGLRRRRARRTLAPRAGGRSSRAGDDGRRTAPPVRSRRKAVEGRGAGRAGRGAARARDRGSGPRRERGGPRRPRPRGRGKAESGRSLPASPVTTRRAGRPPRPTAQAAASPPRPGRGEGGAGRPSPARRGYPRARARGGHHDDDDDRGSAAGGRGHHRRGSAGVAAPHPSVAPHRRPATPAAAAAAAAAGTAAATAGRAEPPESLNRRPARRPPFGPRSGVWRRRGGNLGGGGEPPRRGALGTWPWGEGNDLHGPAGVPPPLPPSGERPPAGARPTSAATTAASFSGPGVSLSSPALRPRGPPRLGPPRRRGDAARPPSAPRPRAARAPKRGPERPEGGSALRCARGTARPESGNSCRPGKSPAPRCGKGRRSRLLRAPKAPPPPAPSPFPHRPPTGATAGRPAVARRAKQRGEGRARLREGPCRAPLPPGTRAAPRAHRGEPASGELGPPLSGAPARGTRRPAFGGAGRGGREARGRPRPRSPAGTDRRQTGARPAGRGAERANGAGVRATPRARPAGRPGNAAGAEPHR
ncbi:collagen alpha-1(I) chain-like [Ammospiza caudacuta]|uniref:collagen alpha-1(I) chain-like n=1 Tax=Ammospiza caudacuta TaxID=2857398 RepID=UPI00273A1267|nr:collagen alpha-1(I) chain-like [Ammospiza caudacuta]